MSPVVQFRSVKHFMEQTLPKVISTKESSSGSFRTFCTSPIAGVDISKTLVKMVGYIDLDFYKREGNQQM